MADDSLHIEYTVHYKDEIVVYKQIKSYRIRLKNAT